MNKIIIKNIKFTSFMKLFFVFSMCLGILIGILGFIAGIFNGPVYVNIGANVYTGFVGGLLGLIVFPLLSVIFGTILGLLTFYPFKFFLKMKKRLPLYIEVENYEIQNEEISNFSCKSEQN